ncbi:MAG: histidine phosphatase family protein [Ghiorsea sp.]|nr:histidine phosphatase family protein [Ghiorsea sp.]
MSQNVLTIDILRHGETGTNAGKLYGATDVPLSSLGKEQLLQAVKSIKKEPISHIISSPLQRCAWLAEQLKAKSPVSYNANFAEMNFGDWEGQSIQNLLQQQPNFRQDVSQLDAPNGETFPNFHQRVEQAWQAYIEQHTERGGHHLLITHGGVIRVLLGLVLHIPQSKLANLYVPHATWSRITFVQGEPPMLWFMNHHA